MRNAFLLDIPVAPGVLKHESIKSEVKFDEPRIWAVVKELKVAQHRAFIDVGNDELTFAFGWLNLWTLSTNPSEGRHLSITRLGITTAEQWARECLGRVVLLKDVPYYANAERKYNERIERENRMADQRGDLSRAPRVPWVN